MPSPFTSMLWIPLVTSHLAVVGTTHASSRPPVADTTLADSVFAEPAPAAQGKLVKPEGTPAKTAEPELKAPKGSLAIISNPPGAQLLFNSVKQGQTPMIVKLTKPLNRIVVRMHGYETYDAMIEKNTLRREITVTLKPEGKVQPSVETAVAPESKPVIAPKPEGKPASVVAAPPPTPAEVKPKKPVASAPPPPAPPVVVEMGTVFISSSPSHANITLDGKPTGKQTPIKIELPAGIHHVEMEHDGLNGVVDYPVNPGNNKALHLQLQ